MPHCLVIERPNERERCTAPTTAAATRVACPTAYCCQWSTTTTAAATCTNPWLGYRHCYCCLLVAAPLRRAVSDAVVRIIVPRNRSSCGGHRFVISGKHLCVSGTLIAVCGNTPTTISSR